MVRKMNAVTSTLTKVSIERFAYRVSPHADRRGAVMIEFAMVLPVIMFSFACMVEISRVMLLQHTADTAAYEGSRSAMVPGATASAAVTAANELLTAAGLRATKVTVTPDVVTELTPLITVLVEIPVSQNFWISPMLFKDYTVRSEVTLFCERPPVVQLTGVPALKVKSAKIKQQSGGL